MAPSRPPLDAQAFEAVAASCKWSARSLAVARAILIDGLAVADVAKANSMSTQQANVLRRRFLAKAEAARIEAFMQREKPKEAGAEIEPFSADVLTLRDKGYTAEQIVSYLAENGLTTTASTVNSFISRSTRA